MVSLELLQRVATGELGVRAALNRATGKTKDKPGKRANHAKRAGALVGRPTGPTIPLSESLARWVELDATPNRTQEQEREFRAVTCAVLGDDRQKVKRKVIRSEVSARYRARLEGRRISAKPRRVFRRDGMIFALDKIGGEIVSVSCPPARERDNDTPVMLLADMTRPPKARGPFVQVDPAGVDTGLSPATTPNWVQVEHANPSEWSRPVPSQWAPTSTTPPPPEPPLANPRVAPKYRQFEVRRWHSLYDNAHKRHDLKYILALLSMGAMSPESAKRILDSEPHATRSPFVQTDSEGVATGLQPRRILG